MGGLGFVKKRERLRTRISSHQFFSFICTPRPVKSTKAKNCLATKERKLILAYLVFWMAYFFLEMAYLVFLAFGMVYLNTYNIFAKDGAFGNWDGVSGI